MMETENLVAAFGSGSAWQGAEESLPWLLAAVVFGWLALRLLGQLSDRLPAGGRARWPQPEDSGTAVLEFTMVFPFFVIIVLVVVQLAFMINAKLMVQYAAFCAARSAVVWIPASNGNAAIYEREAKAAAAIGTLPVAANISTYRGLQPELIPLVGVRGIFRASSKYRYSLATNDVGLAVTRAGPRKAPLDSVTATVVHKYHLAVPYVGDLFARALGFRYLGIPVVPITSKCTMFIENKLRSKAGG